MQLERLSHKVSLDAIAAPTAGTVERFLVLWSYLKKILKSHYKIAVCYVETNSGKVGQKNDLHELVKAYAGLTQSLGGSQMTKLSVSVIESFDAGQRLNKELGSDVYQVGEMLQIHCLVNGEHVWLEHDTFENVFRVAFGAVPDLVPQLDDDQAKLIFAQHFGVSIDEY